MRWIAELRTRVTSLVFRSREERELEEELRFHLEMEEAANVRRGLSRQEAYRQARLKLGGVEQTREAFRDARGVRPLEDAVRDVRQALRSFMRTPGFTLTAVVVLALGIGATTAIFSAVYAVVLRPLPFVQPERLYMLWESNPEIGWERESASPANYLDWKERVAAFEDVEAYNAPWTVTITGLDRPLALSAASVTGGFFSMLGVQPMLGRDFREEETWAGATWRAGETPLLLSARAWRTVFGGEEGAVGRAVTFNGAEARIVGVMRDGFAFPEEDVDLWVPMGWAEESRGDAWFRRSHTIRPIARLAAGVTAEQAAAELGAVAAQLERAHPSVNRRARAGMSPLQDFLIGDTRTPLLVLLAAAGVLLLIACANLGNLLLVRASGRRRDLAVRAALGAGRGRLVRQMLTESLVLAGIGGAAGIALGVAGTRLLERLQPERLLRVTHFPVDAGVLGFALLATAIATLLFGALPALFARRAGPGEALREAGRSRSDGRRAQRVVGGLVALEVALAVVLVLGAGLLVRSVLGLRQVEPGFEPEGVVAIALSLPGARYPGPAPVLAFYDELLERVRAIPGVSSAAASSTLPLRQRGETGDFFIAGRAPDAYGVEVVHRIMTPGYLETMRVPLLAGRGFTEADVFDGRWDDLRGDRVALINEALARQYFAGENPVGQRITMDRMPDSTSVWRTIVGVVGSERQSDIAMPAQIELIEPFGQSTERRMFIYARVAGGDPTRIVPTVGAIVRELDPELPLIDAVAMEDVVAESMARERFLMLLLAAFAAVAMLLALVGVYGITAQAVRQRLPEFGVRIALGARAVHIVRITLARSMALLGAGLVLGTTAALAGTRLMRGMLYGVAPNDAATFVAVAMLIASAGWVAAWLPARRAARLDPAQTLRAE